uniref:Antimicrobial protein AN5-2 n=1 Tax=Paenibacillus alvei TaxID=44250 RepID=AMP2_PAEAL|nr:RecName: Full=Antimicrobial protein AN5-2 [Paenibacillus alvei]
FCKSLPLPLSVK